MKKSLFLGLFVGLFSIVLSSVSVNFEAVDNRTELDSQAIQGLSENASGSLGSAAKK